MSDISETADLEAQIEALIKKAGDRLRQQLDNVHRGHAAESGGEQSSRPPSSDPGSGSLGDTASRMENER